jgi:hypothetical protein
MLGVAAAHEIDKVSSYFLVSGAIDSPYTWCRALANVTEQAGASTRLCSVEDSLAAASHRVDLQKGV